MATINLWPYGPMQYTGAVGTRDLFGTNFLFSRDGAWQPGQVSQPYKAFASEVGLSIMRYPGGTMTEESFDMANPNDTGNPLPGTKGLVPLSSFLEFASSIGASASIVIPTYRLYTSQFDAQGQRTIDSLSESKVREFIHFTLDEAKAAGTKIQSFELGNEWWVDNTAIFGFRMSPIEYGRIANFLARTIQEAISEYNSEQPSWDKVDPEIAIQVGPGGNAEWYTRAALGLPDIGTGPSITATEAIFLQITDPISQSAIDATLTHRYLHGGDQSISGWQYSPFLYWDTLANQTPGFNTDVRRYVTEWNVSARNTSEIGIKQFDTMVLLTQEMMNAGVDLAAAWAVQQNNSTKLTYNTGLKEADFAGLTFGGLAFDMMATQLPGQRVVFNSGSLSSLQSAVFGSESRVVYFLTNKTGEIRNDVIDRSTVSADVTHVTIYEVDQGPDGKPTVTVRTYALADLPVNVPLILSPDETAMIVLTKGGSGATIEGYDLADNLVGTVGSDSMLGGLKNDLIYGLGGDDSVLGEDGNDTVSGNEGNDILVGGGGDDLVYGGNGDDYIDGNFGADTIFGGAGTDSVNIADLTVGVRLDLSATSNLIPHLGIALYEVEGLVSGIGSDTIFGSNVGNSIDAGGGDDFLDGHEGDDALTGGEGSDTIFGADGNDSLNGDAGMDELFGGSGSDWVIAGVGGDLIYGGSGDDLLVAGDGEDSVFGDDGADVLLGNSGDDSMFGGFGDDRILGNLGSDVVSTGDGDDYADGGGGDDLVWGGAGSDILLGREGDDFIFGNSPTSTAVWITVTCTGLVLSDTHLAYFNNDSGDSVSNGGDRLSGGLGNDTLIGGSGNDRIFGDDGDDWILGSAGADLLWGGSGNDVFIFDPTVMQGATVFDFLSGADRITLLGSLPDGVGTIASFVDQTASVVPDGVLLALDHDSDILFSGQRSLQFLYSNLEFFAI